MNKERSYERYQRQIQLKEFGNEGQQKLLQAKVLVIGAGGLGCPVLQYLAAAGVGCIGIVDDDVVELSNLQRQPLYSVNEIGLSKAITAQQKLLQLNPEININAYNERLTVANALEIIAQYNIVIDGTDNFATRYMINDACVIENKPLIFGAISKFEGQVAVFNCKQNINETTVNYRDLFPQPPKDGEVLNCAQTGVLGVLPGIIGTMMANETIKLITGIGKPLINRMMTYNALTNQVYELALNASEKIVSVIPENAAAFKQMNYDWLCASSLAMQFEIDIERFDAVLQGKNVKVIDVRELHELPLVTEFKTLRIPLGVLKEKMNALVNENIVFFCQSGIRSLQAAAIAAEQVGNKKEIYSLQGGIVAWKKWHEKQMV
jgi:sulfur-carrier protein adenylyltransferase/sulfurtransferase